MSEAAGEFDVGALYDALEAERVARGITWSQLTREVNRPFDNHGSPPIAVSTLKRMRDSANVVSQVVLQALRWLGRTPESFVVGARVPKPDEQLPDVGPLALRVDTLALFKALDEQRTRRDMTWAQVAADMNARVNAGVLKRLANGPGVGITQLMEVVRWLGRPTAAFVRGYPF